MRGHWDDNEGSLERIIKGTYIYVNESFCELSHRAEGSVENRVRPELVIV